MTVNQPEPPAPPARASLSKPTAPALPGPTPAQKPDPLSDPAADPSRQLGMSTVPQGPRRSSITAEKTDRTIFMMTIDLDARRVGLWAQDGFAAIRGDVLTDLPPGRYTLTANKSQEQWAVNGPGVKMGLRFSLLLTGVPNPFNLDYTDKVELLVHKGLPLETKEFEKIKARLIDAVYENDMIATGRLYEDLISLPGVDLYDMVDELWSDPEKGQGTVYRLLQFFDKFPRTEHEEGLEVLHALECFGVPPEKLYVDSFTKCLVHPDSFGDHPYTDETGNADTLLVFIYDHISPTRALFVPSRSIEESGGLPRDQAFRSAHFGSAGLLFPTKFSGNSTPRMLAAKKEKRDEIAAQNYDFVFTAWQGVEMFIHLAGGTANVAPGTGRKPYKGLKRPVTDAARKQPGRWEPEYPSRVGTKDSKYEATTCNKDEGLIYRVGRDGTHYKFDGEEGAGTILLDAKHWEDGGRQVRLMRGDFGIRAFDKFTAKLQERALLQVYVANGRQVKWMVSHPEATRMLQAFMKSKQIPINVVYTPL